jgi:hypothetical protein
VWWWWRGHQEKTNDVGVIHHRRPKVSGLCVVRERESQGKRGRFDIFLDCFDHPFGFFYVENVQENEREKLLAQPSQALIPSLILIIIMDQRN